MKDFVTAEERINDEIRECEGCGQTDRQIMDEQGCSEKEIDDYCVVTNWGSWYCHTDCYRDCHS